MSGSESVGVTVTRYNAYCASLGSVPFFLNEWEPEKQVSCGLTLCTRTALKANLPCLAELAFQRQVVLLEEDDIAEGEEQATLPPLSSSI